MSPTIPQAVSNIANDTQVDLPPSFSRVELTAAVFVAYHDLHGSYPDRHAFQVFAPSFVKALPSEGLEAAVVIATAAAKLLGMPGLATDAQRIQHARETIAQAEADAADIEANRGMRLSRIHSLERILKDLTNQRESWQIDFAAESAAEEEAILEHFGRGYSLNGRFEYLQHLSVLKKLQPAAFKMIDAKIAETESELAELKA